MIDYFSSEFEPDGTRRLYNNGHHPEMEAFVTWMWEGRRGIQLDYWGRNHNGELDEYIRTLKDMYSSYFHAHRDNGFTSVSFSHLSSQMLDAFARAEADPDYELDLTSLQEAGY